MADEVVVITDSDTEVNIIETNAVLSYVDGDGLKLTGSVFNVGEGEGIIVGPDEVSIDSSVVTKKYTSLVGNGTDVSYTVTHNLGNEFPAVILRDANTGAQVFVDNAPVSENAVVLNFGAAPAANAYRVFVVG